MKKMKAVTANNGTKIEISLFLTEEEPMLFYQRLGLDEEPRSLWISVSDRMIGFETSRGDKDLAPVEHDAIENAVKELTDEVYKNKVVTL